MENDKEIKKQLDSLLINNNNGIVVSIQGNWGIGKTYFWSNYIRYAEQGDKFVNISLFGINSLDDIKKKILLKTSDRFKISSTLKKYVGKSNPIGIDLASIVSLISKGEFKNIIICFDDLERISPNLSMSEILGFISELKEQHNCKIVLINNNNVLSNQDKLNHQKIIKRTNQEDKERFIITSTNNGEIFNAYVEKIVDITLFYEPTLKDIFSSFQSVYKDNDYINFALIEELFSQLQDNNKKFNRRLIKQVLLKVELIKKILEKDIHIRIKNGIIFNIFSLVVKEENIDRLSLNIPLVLPFDKQIFINIVEKHQVNIDMFEQEVEKQDSYLKGSEDNETLRIEIESIHQKYLYELEYKDKDFIKEFYKILSTKEVDIVKICSLSSFSWYIELITKLDSSKKNKYHNLFISQCKIYIKNNIDSLYRMNTFYKDEDMKIMNECPILQRFYEKKKEEMHEDSSIDINIIKKLLNNFLKNKAYSYDTEDLLSSISKEKHKTWLVENREYFELMFKFIRKTGTYVGDQPFKIVRNHIIEIYKELHSMQEYENKMTEIIRMLNIKIT